MEQESQPVMSTSVPLPPQHGMHERVQVEGATVGEVQDAVEACTGVRDLSMT